MSFPLLHVAIITYNHEHFIATCIERVLMQKVNFEFSITIYDDCSTDSTGDICTQWALLYGDKIQYIRHPHNIGISANWAFAINHCTAKYFAICEGDDYWIDYNKLQKQIEFLEAHPDCAICHHDYETKSREATLVTIQNLPNKFDYYIQHLDDLANGNFIMTVSAVFRNSKKLMLPDWYSKTPGQDYAFFMLKAREGHIAHINQHMVVYRNEGGAYSSLKEEEQIMIFVKCVANLQNSFTDMPIIRARILAFLIRHNQILIGYKNFEAVHYVSSCNNAFVEVLPPLMHEYHTFKLEENNPSIIKLIVQLKKALGKIASTFFHIS